MIRIKKEFVGVFLTSRNIQSYFRSKFINLNTDKIFTKRVFQAILYRNNHFSYFCQFYYDHNQFPPLRFCDYLRYRFVDSYNPNRFDHFMDIELRDKYVLPNMFIITSTYNRSACSISTSFFYLRNIHAKPNCQ